MSAESIYCPVCEKSLVAINADEVEIGASDGYIFVHDEIPHDDTDLDALDSGIN